MYSIVLVVTLSGGGDVTAWQDVQARPALHTDHLHQADRFRRGGCRGGGGCYGGGGYGGGCYGGGGWGGGCYGGGYSYGCCGCCGGGGMQYAAPAMQMGGPERMPSGKRSYYGENGVNVMPSDGVNTPRRDDRNLDRDLNAPQDRSVPAAEPQRRQPQVPQGDQGNRPPQETRNGSEATILVSLPPDAKLTIDDTLTRSTSARRIFVSPPLERGKTYHYTLKAEAMREGRPVTVSKQIDVRAGQETRVELVLPSAAVVSR
jgi:uncharacterized protein (TIGR03000 family)